MASPMRMKQVLVNLVDNAIKYSLPEDERTQTNPDRSPGGIEVTVFASGNHVFLKISDHGIGIPPAVLPHVFERFYRGDFARSREAGGVGLGLAIVKAIVTAHDGSVSITSELRKGSTVIVELPLATPSESALAEPELSRRKMRFQAT
jgi:two-component system phosphate regulon sensor histidine kinase PhoR